MPPPIPATPKTHQVNVNLGQIITNLERSFRLVNGTGLPLVFRREEYEHLHEEFEATQGYVTGHIRTLSCLRSIFQPAIDAQYTSCVKRWHEGRWVHLLSYQDAKKGRQRIIITPTAIFGGTRDMQVDQGILYYLGVALDLTPPATAHDETDAAIVGFIRCFGAGHQDCDTRYWDYAPPLEHSTWTYIDNIVRFQGRAKITLTPDLEYRYHLRVARNARDLAQEVWRISEKEYLISALDVHEWSEELTRLYKIDELRRFDTDEAYSSEAKRLDEGTQTFLKSLFASGAWQLAYPQFQKDFLQIGCSETVDNNSGRRSVNCEKWGYQFEIEPNTRTRVSKAP